LRAWNIIIDEIFFLDGMDKTEILAAFKPQIFFDDQSKYCDRASKVVPTARVLS
jgi:5'-nucleotidase